MLDKLPTRSAPSTVSMTSARGLTLLAALVGLGFQASAASHAVVSLPGADDPPPPTPTPTDPPSYPTLGLPLGRQLQVVNYFDNEFCVSDCGSVCNVGSGWVRIDQGPNNSTAGLSTNYHVRGNDLFFGGQVAEDELLPVAEVAQLDFDVTGLPERNVGAGPSRVANGGGGIWELQSGTLQYVAPIPWSAGLLNAKNGSISGAYAYREGSLYQYDGGGWVSLLEVSGAAGSVTSGGDLVYVDEGTTPPTLHMLEASGFGFWFESGSYQGPEVADWLSFEFSGDWLVANGDGDSYGIFRRGAQGDLVLVDAWERSQAEDPYYWMELKGNGTTFARLQFLEPSEIELFRLETDTPNVSISAAGAQQLRVCAPETWAGRTFLVLGSISGTVPGIVFESDVLPINYDGYLHFCLTATGNGIVQPQVGPLNTSGKGVNTVLLPPGIHPACAGVVANHIALLFEPNEAGPEYLRWVGPASLELVP